MPMSAPAVTLHECKQAVASTCQKNIGQGNHAGFMGALESFVAKSPAKATWEQRCNWTITTPHSNKGNLRVGYPDNLEDWQKAYINAAISNRVEWASLSAACFLDTSTILRQETTYPVAFDIQGTLPSLHLESNSGGKPVTPGLWAKPAMCFSLGILETQFSAR